MNRRHLITLSLPLVGLLALIVGLSACGGGEDADLTVYSGRSEDLIGPIIERFEEETDLGVEVRYGDSSEVALLIEQEGESSPADAVITQSPTPLTFLDRDGLLAPIPNELFNRVPATFRDRDGSEWMGISGRNRVLVINTDQVDASEIPDSVFGLTDERFAGRVAVAPENGSFQEFVAVAVAERGEDEVRDWLEAMAANGSPGYSNNSSIVDAVARGEVDMGLVNNYYIPRALEEAPDLPIEAITFPGNDVGSLVLPSSAAILAAADNPEAAEQLIRFLTEPEAQTFFADVNKEYALAGSDTLPLEDAFPFPGPGADLELVANLISESDIGQ